MDEIDTPQTTSSESTKSPNYSLRRASMAAGAILGVTAGVGIGNFAKDEIDKFDHKPVASEVVTVQYGDELTSSAERVVENYFNTNNLDLTKIPYDRIAEASITAADRMNDRTGESTTQPGEQFAVSIEKNDYGDYSVEIIPALPSTASGEDEKPTDAYQEFADQNDIEFYDPSDEQRAEFNDEAAKNLPTPETH